MAQSLPRVSPFLFLVLLPAAVGAASFPPSYRFRTLETPRVSVHYHQGLEAMARQAATLATEILERHEARYGYRVPRLHVVMADNEDDSNGFATPLPYPLVHIKVAAPDGSDDFGNHEGWLRLVLSHEIAHIVHLDESRGIIRFGRKLLGRAPYLFPNVFTPTWMIEGLATYEETQTTAFGRGRNPDSRMVVRMAALEERFPKEDQAVYGLDAWPGGQAAYLFGEEFLRDLTARHGEDVMPALARKQSGKVLPFLDDFTASEVTGQSFHAQWQAWARDTRVLAEQEAARRGTSGLTESRPLTTRGIRQWEPAWSPDGQWIAYSSQTLTRFPEIRIVRADGADDRPLARRNGGSGLAFTPDGKTLVYAETEVWSFFSTREDLRSLDVATHRVRKITKGLRARDPDVSPDGRTIVFSRRMVDRSELYLVGFDGKDLRPLTESMPGTEWSRPAFSPGGDRVAAARLLPGGWLDVVVIELATRAVTPLTDDRAKDVEPRWTPDGSTLVFRSDRDGVSNLYAVRVSDRSLWRVTNVLGGAFTPAVSPSGEEVAFASYSAQGYDVRVAPLEVDRAPAAEPFDDPYPAAHAPVEPDASADRPYRPAGTLLPRFWTPYAYSGGGEWKIGAATGGSDPLFRHAYGLAASHGTESGRFNFNGFYQYDRFFPTFLLTAEDTTDVQTTTRLRTREVNAQLSFPVYRTLRTAQAMSLTWRGERQDTLDLPASRRSDLGGIEVAWTLSTAQQYPYSISPVEGTRLRLAYEREDPSLGSDVALSKVTADGRIYHRVFGERDAIALRAQGGFTRGQPGFTRSFAVGGFPDSSLFDLVSTNLAVLRGYPDDAFYGRAFAAANVEYRLPLDAVQRGWRTLPLFVRHLHAAAFFDAAHAWSDEFRWADVKTAAGVQLGTDSYLGHRLPFTGVAGVGHGFAAGGETRFYFRLGLAF